MADAESVSKALEALRDAADDQSRAENPDLKQVAEAFNSFHEEWASKSEADAKAEQNPDEVPANAEEIASRESDADAKPKPTRSAKLQASADKSVE